MELLSKLILEVFEEEDLQAETEWVAPTESTQIAALEDDFRCYVKKIPSVWG